MASCRQTYYLLRGKRIPTLCGQLYSNLRHWKRGYDAVCQWSSRPYQRRRRGNSLWLGRSITTHGQRQLSRRPWPTKIQRRRQTIRHIWQPRTQPSLAIRQRGGELYVPQPPTTWQQATFRLYIPVGTLVFPDMGSLWQPRYQSPYTLTAYLQCQYHLFMETRQLQHLTGMF